MGRKALYVHGMKTDKDKIVSTGNAEELDRSNLDLSAYKKGASFVNVKELLAECGYDAISGDFDLFDVEGTLQKIKNMIQKEKISLLVASSLGGFYAIALQSNAPVIALNPCLSASAEVPKLHDGVAEKILAAWRDMESGLASMKPVYKRFKHAIFAENDELFHYKDTFDAIFGKDHSLLVPGPHQLSRYRAFLDKPVADMLKRMKDERVI